MNDTKVSKAKIKRLIKVSKECVIEAITFQSKNSSELTDSQYGCIKMALEQIELAKSIETLLENEEYFGINALLRLMLERTIYTQSILKDPIKATSYLLACQIEAIESQIVASKLFHEDAEIVSSWIDVGNTRISINYEELPNLKNKYKSLFKNPKNIQHWYNTSGDTPSFLKLIAWVGASKKMVNDYRFLSHSVHASGGLLYTEIFLRSNGSVLPVVDRYMCLFDVINYLSSTMIVTLSSFGLRKEELYNIKDAAIKEMVDRVVGSSEEEVLQQTIMYSLLSNID
jgi:hypothetical protein